ncbi:Uncharacterized protein GcC1_149011 [Golovinomyces cichoracearum]|uniref:Uncharacterized protein n=1 Tax=Golovinomyces cichoracearum TaxID=62708 RepID=A0A420HXQ4_9PEZI|nr:Uncharacterized protein GcC1_149011 [Golovinomyces cichoracearum]
MKPVVSAIQAWSCIVISVFAIVILSVICVLFKSNHHSMMGSINDPPDGAAIAGTVFSAVIVYAVFLACCSFQAFLHVRESRRGVIRIS